jgi:class 3 adenylate cyclase
MAVAGLSEMTPDHAANIARVALRMRRYLERRNAAQASRLDYRVGISTGPVIGSVIGLQRYVYDVFGPAVSLAARLQHLSEPMQITVCERTYALLRDDFVLSEREVCEVKGFGPRRLYLLEGEATRAR